MKHLLVLRWYIIFGFLHELFHLFTAYYLLGGHQVEINLRLAVDIIFWRQCSLGNVPPEIEKQIMSAGWLGSVLVVFITSIVIINKSRRDDIRNIRTIHFASSSVLLAALVTALEALSTDLLGWKPTFQLGTPTPSSIFYCGNFGIILLNHWWLKDNSKTVALDTLQKMIEVTMLRGAQSGGCLTYYPIESNDKSRAKISSSKAVRSRVVNKKRTDLSKLVRKRVEKIMPTTSHNVDEKSFVPRMFVGHTRFATSSLSTLDGTHPHRWTPPSPRRVYSMENDETVIQSSIAIVENYITHNGDFDFYQSHGKLFELDIVQNWLSVVTETTTPASVDSCAIAGMVDILRAKGSFGLSARYAISLGMESSNCGMKNADGGRKFYFPRFKYLEDEIGYTFEKVLNDYCSKNSIDDLQTVAANTQARIELAEDVSKELKCWPKDRIRPLKKAMNSVQNPRSNVIVNNISNIYQDTAKTNPRIVITENEDHSTNLLSNVNVEEPIYYTTNANDVESNPIDDENLRKFCRITIDAFFDNDLFFTTKEFMASARGSFGISITSNLDSYRQICLAARGQTISIAFYPQIDLICYGSEQAAVKAGMNVPCDGLYYDDKLQVTNNSSREVDYESVRLDLDDLGGEICVLDWGRKKYQTSPVSIPNQHLAHFQLMNGKITAVLHQQSKSTKIDSELYHRMTKLSGNSLIQPLKKFSEDPVKTDIDDIPRVCKDIQDDWHSRRAATSLNRLTAFNLSRCLRLRLEQHVSGTVPSMAVDILLTGCEVSLYVAEQFATDLKKAFPKLNIEAISSNKLLGGWGQEIAVPSLGFPYSPTTMNIHDSIVIIVSHSGGTFGPLACSNLLQSATQNIFVVTSEWDTQISKQLRMIDEMEYGTSGYLMNQRIFSTSVGMRPAEPCSVSVVATHQLLTNLFEYISVIILSDKRFCTVTKAQITEQDIQILERCNQMNINALTEICGVNAFGYSLDCTSSFLANLRQLGNLWGDHILEGARAYILSFIYIFATVTSGWPLMRLICHSFGAAEGGAFRYFFQLLDACIYFFLPQICITIIRIFQGRNLRHRMVGRTIVIADIPWVSQCADAFLSKCFAVSYSIASLNVLSGNPSDHFVHRHTHRVVRGTLAIFGRADGRLSALSTAEASACLSCNQASSIQSYGGTCESITIGHNPFKLPLTKAGIFLKRHRPLFLCERLLMETDAADEERTMHEKREDLDGDSIMTQTYRDSICKICTNIFSCFRQQERVRNALSMSVHSMMDCSICVKIHKKRSSHALIGAYMSIEPKDGGNANSSSNEDTTGELDSDEMQDSYSVDDIIDGAIKERKVNGRLHVLFNAFDKENKGFLTQDDFIAGIVLVDPLLLKEEAKIMFKEADTDHSCEIDYNQFVAFLQNSGYYEQVKVPPGNRDERGLIQIEAIRDKYFGETLRKYNAGKNNVKDMDYVLAKCQHLVQELYETRIASMQRYVVLCVLFHHIAKRVETFFAKISLGYWSYRIDRTHSIVRIATTASPISGSDVRNRIERLRLWKRVVKSVHIIELAYLSYCKRKLVTKNHVDRDGMTTT